MHSTKPLISRYLDLLQLHAILTLELSEASTRLSAKIASLKRAAGLATAPAEVQAWWTCTEAAYSRVWIAAALAGLVERRTPVVELMRAIAASGSFDLPTLFAAIDRRREQRTDDPSRN